MTHGNACVINLEQFDELVEKGFNCKEIAHELGVHPHSLGLIFKRQFNIYPSVYIANKKKIKEMNGTPRRKTKNLITITRGSDRTR